VGEGFLGRGFSPTAGGNIPGHGNCDVFRNKFFSKGKNSHGFSSRSTSVERVLGKKGGRGFGTPPETGGSGRGRSYEMNVKKGRRLMGQVKNRVNH